MSETNEPGTAVAVQEPKRAARAVAVVESAIPIFDTNRFEHYGRIAAVMARASLIPAALRGDSYEEAAANCFLVVNQADRWGMDPFAVAQCCSVVYGRLMYEGKLVAAVLKSKLKVDLHYHFTGVKGKDDYRAYVSDREFTDDLIAQLAPGKSYRGWRVIDGSVAEWQTFEKDKRTVSPAWRSQPDMQLRYRGARVWCRVYESAIMLGVYTEDDVDILAEQRRELIEQRALPRPTLDPGFPPEVRVTVEAPRTAEVVVAHPTAGATAEATSAPHGGQDGGVSGEEAKIVATDDGGAPTGERVDQATGEVTGAAEQRQGESAPAAAAPSGPEAATPASVASTATAAGTPATGAATSGGPDVSEGVAGPGEEYHLTRDEPGPMGMRPAYKDGLRVGDSGPGAELFTYANHAPRLEDKKPAGEPASKSPPSSSVSPPADDFPGDRPSTEAHPFIEAIGKIAEAEHWDAIKQVARTLAGTALWKESERSARMPVQEAMWDRYCELPDQIAVSMDYTLMSLWLRFGAKSLAEIDEMWPTFWRKGAYKDAKDADKLAITELMEQRKAAFRAPS